VSRYWSQLAPGLSPSAPGEQPQVTDLVKLNTNESPFGPSPMAIVLLRSVDRQASYSRDLPDQMAPITRRGRRRARARHGALGHASTASVWPSAGHEHPQLEQPALNLAPMLRTPRDGAPDIFPADLWRTLRCPARVPQFAESARGFFMREICPQGVVPAYLFLA
jgi:hypothetical protein